MKIDKCKKCGAEIVWVKTKRGKQMPCNTGQVTIIDSEGELFQGWIPHWVTCPYAEDFRKK